MPLVRVEVRNEYGLGAPELYKDADKEDPKTLLEGLAVAGLVGILRQLGDLAEFAAEVFHGIQEQVTSTSSRSHKLMGRVKQIEAALPPLEKLVLAQSNHLHFAYTPGLNWRANLHNEQCHFIYSDLPRFMMNSYEQCRGPPNLNKLDKFDPGGPGSCLKRYSDPSFFRKTLKGSGLAQKKSRKIKKKRSWLHNGEISRGVSNYSGSVHFPSLSMGEQTSPCPTVSTYELKDLDLGYQSLSFDSRNGSVDFEHVSQPRFPMPYKERDSTGSCSSQSRMQHNDTHNFASTGSKDAVLYCDSPGSISGEGLCSKSNQVTWDEKMEMLVAETREHNHDEMLEISPENLGFENNEGGTSHLRDESMEVFPSNLDLDNDDKVSNHFHTSEVNLQKGSVETLSTDVNVENPRGSVVFETAAQMDIVPENENWSMEVSDDVHHDDLHCGTVVEMNTHLDDKNVLLSNSGDFQRDEIESETDHFVDALNAIESEYESDTECQTKQEMEQHSQVDSKENYHGEDKDRLVTPPVSGIILSSPEIVAHTNGSSNVDTSGIHPDLDLPEFCSEVNTSPDKISTDQPNSVPFESHASFQPQLPDDACNSISSLDVDDLLKNDIVGSSNVESAVYNVSFLGRDVLVPGKDKNPCCSPVVPKPPPEPSTASSTMLWTNGGLLGLEPSKPPDFSSANMGSQIPEKCKEETITSYIPKSNVKEKSDTSLKEDAFSECSTSYQDDRKSGNLTRKAQRTSLSTDLGVNLLKLSNSFHQTYSGNIQNDAYTQPGDVQPVRPDIKSSRASQERSNSSRMLELGNKLLLNGFYRKPALLKDESSYQDGSVNDNGFEQCKGHDIGCQTFSARGRDMLGSESPLISPASSPPLGHMKISFQPINGSKAPNLQLKLPDGNFNHEGGRDLFTSFQLVPDPNIEFRDFGTDSDDDTFCQSSPNGSDYISHQSDSNSEQWESRESPSKKEEDLYDALRRISLTESVPKSWGTTETVHGDINNNYTQLSQFPRDTVDGSYSSHLYDELPNLESVHPSFKEVRSNCVPEQHYHKEFTSSPLPLHESQWEDMKPQSEFPESRQINMPENPGHVFDGKLESTVTQKPKPAPQSQEEINWDTYLLKSKSQELRKLTPVKDLSQASNGNLEPKGDFLQQIRAKSLNLRRTAIPKPSVAADTTNVQVNAILEKANAIRKAVGSDREDDNWSDT